MSIDVSTIKPGHMRGDAITAAAERYQFAHIADDEQYLGECVLVADLPKVIESLAADADHPSLAKYRRWHGEVRQEAADLRAENQRLRRWKDEALPVLDGLQELGRALDLPGGTRIVDAALTEVAALKAERDWLAAVVERVKALLPVWQNEADEFRYDYELKSAETLDRARLELLRALVVREGDGGES